MAAENAEVAPGFLRAPFLSFGVSFWPLDIEQRQLVWDSFARQNRIST